MAPPLHLMLAGVLQHRRYKMASSAGLAVRTSSVWELSCSRLSQWPLQWLFRLLHSMVGLDQLDVLHSSSNISVKAEAARPSELYVQNWCSYFCCFLFVSTGKGTTQTQGRRLHKWNTRRYGSLEITKVPVCLENIVEAVWEAPRINWLCKQFSRALKANPFLTVQKGKGNGHLRTKCWRSCCRSGVPDPWWRWWEYPSRNPRNMGVPRGVYP